MKKIIVYPAPLCGVGFTLIELLVVIAIMAILATVVFVALDPITRFADARDSRRVRAVENISTGIRLYQVDNDGAIPVGIDGQVRMLGSGSGCSYGFEWDGSTHVSEADCLDIASVMSKYLKIIPIDPELGDSGHSYYGVRVVNGVVEVMSMGIEDGGGGSQPTPSSTPTPPTVALSASISISSDWGTGYCADLAIENVGSVDASSWEVGINLNNSSMDSSWSANFASGGGSAYVLTPLGWNGEILVGNTLTGVGFCASATGAGYLPSVDYATGVE